MTASLEGILRRDRRIAGAGLLILVGLSWTYLFGLAGDMAPAPAGASRMDGMGPTLQPWTVAHFVTMFAMWSVMMVAMMVPSAAPMILLHARVQRHSGGALPRLATWSFTGGYLTAWTAFSLAATTLQCVLEQAALLSPMMVSTSRWLGAGVLLAAGIYQITPLKDACLSHCRSPVQFVSQHWRPGVAGAFRMGLHHGAYCVGCCWFLMALLFVGGVMNLLWIAALSIFVLLEKVVPGGRILARASGVALAVAAGAVALLG